MPNFLRRCAVARPIVLALLFVSVSASVRTARSDDEISLEQSELFERQVRPLLVEHCFSCHGKGQSKGGLSLDSRAALVRGGESGPAFDEAERASSLLLEAVTYESGLQMPPSGKLSDAEIAVLRQWILLGAPWPASTGGDGGIRAGGEISASDRAFWSFVPPQRQPLPEVGEGAWSRVPIDRYIAARHQAEQLAPSPDADRATLARRLALDLTGLPLAADQVDEYVQDDLPDATARLVDRLLASPRHGERWSRHWLDVARFGEDQAHTFQARLYPEGYRFRDWVVRSLNEDLPYDEFVRQQVAGDLLREPEARDALPALGFFALGPVYYADAGCAPKALADEWDDRVDTLSRGFLGLTVACARCHDHKFDPISMRDYYALAGVFASTRYSELPLVAANEVQRYNEAQEAVKQQEKAVNDLRASMARRVSEESVPQVARYLVASWTLANRRRSDSGFSLAEVSRAEGLVEPMLESWFKFLGSDQVEKKALLAPWREFLASIDASQDLAGNAEARNRATVAAQSVQNKLSVALERRRQLEREHEAALAAAAARPASAGEAAPSKIAKPVLEKEHADLLKEWLEDGKSPLVVPKEKLDPFLDEKSRGELAAAQRELDERKQRVGAKYAFAHGIEEGEAKNLKIHLRGDHRKLGDEAPRRFLEVLTSGEPAPVTSGSGRRELARALSSRDNPLTARVWVNRVWLHHFGRGLVTTPSNFGTLGARPSHPELLDDLAVRFMDAGWSTKWLHRELVLSRTYGLSAERSEGNQARDPDNRWLWRASRRRLDIETWRDSLLMAANLLDLRMGGAGEDLASGNHRRRTLYSKVSRHELNSMLRLFDFPDPNLTSEQRVITTVPLQQLFVLNSDFMVRLARELAARVEREAGGDEEARIDRAYEAVFARRPTSDERTIAAQFLSAAREEKSSLSPWIQLCQALLATNELQFVD